jgi:hypothetical protein
MKIQYYVTFAILCGTLGLFLMGCSQDDSSSGIPTGPSVDDIRDYFPLELGYTWTYDSYFTGGGFDTTITREIVGSHLFDSGIIVYFEAMPPENDYLGWACDEDGLYYYGEEELDEQYLYLVVPNPPDLDTTISIEDAATFKILSLDNEVTCPAGCFSCIKIKVEYPGTGVVQLYYLAREIGIVRWEEWSNWEFLKHYELCDYSTGL